MQTGVFLPNKNGKKWFYRKDYATSCFARNRFRTFSEKYFPTALELMRSA